MAPGTSSFEGLGGRIAAKVMARMNAESEMEAVALLAPDRSATVLAVGIGPGIGVRALAARLDAGRVVGIDPSCVMVEASTKENGTGIAAGRVEIMCTAAHRLPWPAGTFDGVVAVNSIQLWDPLPESMAEVARVMRPGARLVAMTHEWALVRAGGSVSAWFTEIQGLGAAAGLTDLRVRRGRAEHGRSVVLEGMRGAAGPPT
jgi:SAM-dependent methyltransferase